MPFTCQERVSTALLVPDALSQFELCQYGNCCTVFKNLHFQERKKHPRKNQKKTTLLQPAADHGDPPTPRSSPPAGKMINLSAGPSTSVSPGGGCWCRCVTFLDVLSPKNKSSAHGKMNVSKWGFLHFLSV